ncbi:hypothetical protein [Lentzea sp. NBRC 105346]|nr:hypothetical protein [Lentzea sp. NBRC 105346]
MSPLFSHPDTHEPHTPVPAPDADGEPSYQGLFQEPSGVTNSEER